MQKINNDIYNHYGDGWYQLDDDPIALLRAEQKIKNPWILERIPKDPCHILDIGCGAGFLTNYLAKYGHTVTGLDMSKSSLEIAQKYDETKKVKYIEGDAYKLPFPDNSVDVVTAMDFLEHVEDPEKVVKEASRVLKPGGLFFYHTFSRNPLSWLFVIKLPEWLIKKTAKNIHLLSMFINPNELKTMCEQNHMTVQAVTGIKPIFMNSAFWSSVLTRKVHPKFTFEFTSLKLISYMGFSQKAK